MTAPDLPVPLIDRLRDWFLCSGAAAHIGLVAACVAFLVALAIILYDVLTNGRASRVALLAGVAVGGICAALAALALLVGWQPNKHDSGK